MKQWELVLSWGGFEIYNESNIYKTKCFFTLGVSILKEGQTLLQRFNSRILRTKRCDRIRIIKISKKNLHYDTEICKLLPNSFTDSCRFCLYICSRIPSLVKRTLTGLKKRLQTLLAKEMQS